MSKLLVVDDEQSICWGLTQLGESIGHEVLTASSAERAFEIAEEQTPDLIVLDVRLPGIDGLSAIERFQHTLGNVPIVIITAYGDLRTAVEAVRNGAFEYIVKPFDLDTIQHAISRALNSAAGTRRDVTPKEYVGGLVGKTPPMQEVFKRIALAAAANANVLLSGESGTGKELAARAIHRYSSRADGPFVAVNVASLSSSLAESELFGHTRGAFTGAEDQRSGLLEQAHGGTLFLDEVADIPLPTQVKLLRVLEHGEFLPVGSNVTARADFRVISATHQDLLDRVAQETFRHDLYFRLSSFQIDLPPLRDRRDDVVELAEHFLHDIAGGESHDMTLLAEATVDELKRRPWHGNVRELRNAMEHAVILARGSTVLPEHLPATVESVAAREPHPDPRSEDAIQSLIWQWARAKIDDSQEADDLHDQLLATVEPPLLRAVMEQCNGQCAAAARKLGMHRVTLKKKLDQLAIDVASSADADESES